MTLISLSITPDMEEKIFSGHKCCTSRREKKGIPGDTFVVRDRVYRILHVHKTALYSIGDFYHTMEGFSSPEEFQAFWESIYSSYSGSLMVYIHIFAYAGNAEDLEGL